MEPVQEIRHIRKKKFINWSAIAAIGPMFALILGWAVSIEVRMTQHSNIQTLENELNAIKLESHQDNQTTSNQINAFTTEVRGLVRRIQNLEEILTPMLVDFRVRKELETRTVAPSPAPAAPKANRGIVEPSAPPPSQKIAEAEKWAQEAISRGQTIKK